MEKCWNKYGLLFFLILITLPLAGQKTLRSNQTKIEKERKKIEKQIRLSNKLLKETNYKRDKSLNELALLNQQIKLRESLVQAINQEIEDADQRLVELNEIICSMEEDIEAIKLEYARSAQITYKNLSNESLLVTILSANSFMEAWHRSSYILQFSKFRKLQLERLKSTSGFLTRKSTELADENLERKNLLSEKQEELQLLVASKKNQNTLFFALKDKEATYRNRLNNQRKALKSLIRKVDTRYNKPAPAVKTAVGKSFAKQKGFLPWPVQSSQGIVIGAFGVTEDPYGNQITNDGIFIRTPIGANVRSIFKGKVTGVQKVPLSGTMVIIEHGQFRTVYANLEQVTVTMGDAVTANQVVGTVRTDERTQETVLNFLIYRLPGKFENPLYWVIKN